MGLYFHALRRDCAWRRGYARDRLALWEAIVDALDGEPTYGELARQAELVLTTFRIFDSEANRVLTMRIVDIADFLDRANLSLEASRLLDKALAIQGEHWPNNRALRAYIENARAMHEFRHGEVKIARENLVRSYRDLVSQYPQAHAYVRQAIRRLITVYDATGYANKAATYRAKLPASEQTAHPENNG